MSISRDHGFTDILILRLALLSIASIPIRYNAIIGPATNHIVSPLPSGVIIAPKITKTIIAYRKLCLQNLGSIRSVNEIAYIIIGSSNAIPKPRKNCSTNDIKSLILRNVSTPIAWPYL